MHYVTTAAVNATVFLTLRLADDKVPLVFLHQLQEFFHYVGMLVGNIAFLRRIMFDVEQQRRIVHFDRPLAPGAHRSRAGCFGVDFPGVFSDNSKPHRFQENAS